MLTAKVTVPEPVKNYFYRHSLMQQLDRVTDHRVTALRAPAGFGKTTALARMSRRQRDRGFLVAWVSVDEDDTPSILGNYVAYAFASGGLDLSILNDYDAWSATPFTHRMGVLAGAIEGRRSPCVLVFDELERLPRQSVGLLDFLLNRGPRNLHVAFAYRSNPGVDLATHVLNGTALIVSTEQLRFSRSEVARFFAGELSRRELDDVLHRTAGWPVALTVDRIARASDRDREFARADPRRVTDNFLGTRLLRGLTPEERRCLLELASFDWIDKDLVDEVLGSSRARRVVEAAPGLDGFLLPLDPDGDVRRLHPIVRRFCIDVLSAEDPDRERSLRVRIARALAARGHLVEAWRQASEAGDDRLVAELMERAGGFRLWLRDGMPQLVAAERFLTPDILRRYPRLALLRSIAHRLGLRLDEAQAQFRRIEQATDGFTRDREGGDASALFVDAVFTRAVLNGGSCHSLHDALDAARPEPEQAGAVGEGGRFVLAAWHTLRCVSCYERALFGACREHGHAAVENFTDDVRYGRVHASIYTGMAAMAEGRVQEAIERYRRARELTRKFFPTDACLAVVTDVLFIELDLERNRTKAIEQRTLAGLTKLRGAWFDLYSTAVGVSAELTRLRHGGEAELELLADAFERICGAGFESTFLDYVAALRVAALLEAGHVDEAGRLWRDAALPDAVELLDFDRRSWRSIEVLAGARVKLLAARGDLGVAATLADRLRAAASDRGLTRTAIRGLALSMEIAERSGREEQAAARLAECLRLTAENGYVRPLVRCAAISRDVVRRLLGTPLEPAAREAAEALLGHLGGPPETAAPVLSPREREVLDELTRGGRNKEMASRLGITEAGVRYHLKNLYRKLGVKGRKEAMRQAQAEETGAR